MHRFFFGGSAGASTTRTSGHAIGQDSRFAPMHAPGGGVDRGRQPQRPVRTPPMSLRGGPAPLANRGNAHARDARAGSGLPVKLPVSETAAETASLSARTTAIEWPILDQWRLRAVASTYQDALVWAGRTAAHLRALNHRQAHGAQAEHRLRATSHTVGACASRCAVCCVLCAVCRRSAFTRSDKTSRL